MSATDAGIRASNGAIQKPCKALATANEVKLLASAAQKEVTASPRVVTRYTGRLPTLTAIVLQSSDPTAMAAIRDPLQPNVKFWSETLNSVASGTKAGVRSGPIASRC